MTSATKQPTSTGENTAGELAIPLDMVDGYRDGFRGDPKPGSNRSHSYRHGWTVGNGDRRGVSAWPTPEAARAASQTAILRDLHSPAAPPTSDQGK